MSRRRLEAAIRAGRSIQIVITFGMDESKGLRLQSSSRAGKSGRLSKSRSRLSSTLNLKDPQKSDLVSQDSFASRGKKSSTNLRQQSRLLNTDTSRSNFALPVLDDTIDLTQSFNQSFNKGSSDEINLNTSISVGQNRGLLSVSQNPMVATSQSAMDDDATEFTKAEIQFTHRFEEVRDGVYSLQYSYDSSALVVGYGDGGIDVLSTITGKVEREVRKHRSFGLAVTCTRFNPQLHHTFFAGTVEGKVYCCSVVDGTSQEIINEKKNEINCLDFAMDGLSFATAGRDLSVRIYDSQTQKPIHTYEGYSYVSTEAGDVSGHAQRVFALRYHPDYNHVFITGGWDNHLKVWDARLERGVVRTIHGPHICGDALDIRGTQLLTGSWRAEDALQVWEYGEGRLVETIPVLPHHTPSTLGGPPGGRRHAGEGECQGEFLYSAQFCDNGVVLAGGSGTNSALAINTRTSPHTLIEEVPLEHPIQAIDSTNGGRLFAVAGGGCKLRMVKMYA